VNDISKQALEAVIAHLGEQHRPTVEKVYRLGVIDGNIEANKAQIARMGPSREGSHDAA